MSLSKVRSETARRRGRGWSSSLGACAWESERPPYSLRQPIVGDLGDTQGLGDLGDLSLLSPKSRHLRPAQLGDDLSNSCFCGMIWLLESVTRALFQLGPISGFHSNQHIPGLVQVFWGDADVERACSGYHGHRHDGRGPGQAAGRAQASSSWPELGIVDTGPLERLDNPSSKVAIVHDNEVYLFAHGELLASVPC